MSSFFEQWNRQNTQQFNPEKQFQDDSESEEFASEDSDEFEEDEDLAPENAEFSYEDSLSEVEIRIHKANYYRAILENDLFGGDLSHVAVEVSREFREFALSRVRILLGIEKEKSKEEADSAFSPEQTDALRMWADRLISKPGLIAAATQPQAQPQVTSPMVKPPQVMSVPKLQVSPQPRLNPTAKMAKSEPKKATQPAQQPQARPTARIVSQQPTKPAQAPQAARPTAKTKKRKAQSPPTPMAGAIPDPSKKVTLAVEKVVNGKVQVVEKEFDTSPQQSMPAPNDPSYKPMPNNEMMLMMSRVSAGNLEQQVANSQVLGSGLISHFQAKNPNEVSPDDDGVY